MANLSELFLILPLQAFMKIKSSLGKTVKGRKDLSTNLKITQKEKVHPQCENCWTDHELLVTNFKVKLKKSMRRIVLPK